MTKPCPYTRHRVWHNEKATSGDGRDREKSRGEKETVNDMYCDDRAFKT